MNLRHFTIALLMSALPLTAFADYGIILNEGDFKSAKRVSAKGETLLRIKLSKSGKAKLRKLPEEALQKTIQINIVLRSIKGYGLNLRRKKP